MTYWYEEDAAQQGSSKSRLHYHLQALISLVVTSEQCCDVKGQLCDGTERCVHHGPDSKVTLSGNTENKDQQLDTALMLISKVVVKFWCCAGVTAHLAMPMPM